MMMQFDDIVLQVVNRLQSVIPQGNDALGAPKVAAIMPMQNPALDIETWFNSSQETQLMVTYSGNAAEGYKHVEAYIQTLKENTQYKSHTIEVHICSKIYMQAGPNNTLVETPASKNNMLRLMWVTEVALRGLKMYARDNGTSAISETDVATPAANGDVISGIMVGDVQLFMGGTLTLVSDNTLATEIQIANAINAFSYMTGFCAEGINGTVKIFSPSITGAAYNGVEPVLGNVSGTLVLDAPDNFADGVNGTGQPIMNPEHQETEGMFHIESFVDRNYPGVVTVCRFQVMEVATENAEINAEDIWGLYKTITIQEYSGAVQTTNDTSGSPNQTFDVPVSDM